VLACVDEIERREGRFRSDLQNACRFTRASASYAFAVVVTPSPISAPSMAPNICRLSMTTSDLGP